MSSPARILIIRFSSLGDIIQVMAVAAYVRQLYPQAEIHWLTKAAYGDLVAACLQVDQVWRYDSRGEKLAVFCRQLREQNFDLLLDLHSVWRSMLARHYIGAKKTLVYHKPYWRRFWLFHCHHDTFAPDFHVIADYCSLLGRPSARPLAQLTLPAEQQQWARKLLAGAVDAGTPWVACITGAAWPQKRYPIELWKRLLVALAGRCKANFLLVGGPQDSWLGQLADSLPAGRSMLANSYSIMDTLALLSVCKTAIGNDTGFMHGAEALGLDVLFLLGPTSRHGGGYPNRPNSLALEAVLPCRPCSQKGDRPCCRKRQECFYLLDQTRIINELLSRLR